jgi:nucleotide-binding universal stress UspA family protein
MAQVSEAGALDGFSVLEKVHAGGFGEIRRVARPDLGGPLVMKLALLGDDAPASTLAAHEAERGILVRLRGPHVPRLVTWGGLTTAPYLVLEEVRGTSLRSWADRAPLRAAEVARLGAALAQALSAVHAQRVVHLDVKPENVLVREDGTAVLVDFGLARHADLPDLVAEEVVRPMGSPAYVSPEQLLGVRDDPRSDLFALGVVLYELATGRLPFGAPTSDRGLRRRLFRDPVPPRAVVADVPPWLQEVVLWCLERDPAARPAGAEEVARALADPAGIPAGERSRRTRRDPLFQVLLRWVRAGAFEVARRTVPPPVVAGSRAVVVAVATTHTNEARHHQLREAVRRLVQADGACRLTCVSVLDGAPWQAEAGPAGSRALRHLALLRAWAEPLGLPEGRVGFHVLEGSDATETLLEYARANPVHHLVVGAPPPDEALKRIFGTVSSRLADEAPCDVTVVRYAV